MAGDHRLADLAAEVGGRVEGDPDRRLHGVATLEQATERDLGFLTNVRYRAAARASRAGAVLVGPGTALPGRDLLVVDEPYLALARLLLVFHPPPPRTAAISPDARIAAGVRLGAEVSVGPFAVIESGVELDDRVTVGAGSVVGESCRLGADTELKPRVVLYPGTRVGRRCLIHSGVVLGADGFGFATVGGRHHKVPQCGVVVVEDDVEIGANSTVDRGALGETSIGESSKLDDLVMVAHGVRLGAGALLAAQSGIAGSTRVGPRAVFAGQSGAAGHLELGEQVVVAAKSAVFRDLPPGAFVAGSPAIEHRRWKRAQSLFAKLPELRRELVELRRRVAALERERG